MFKVKTILLFSFFQFCASLLFARGEDDIFYSGRYTVRADPMANFNISGTIITLGRGPREGSVGSEIGIAQTKLWCGKTTISFIPQEVLNYVHVNPDMIIKTLPFAHYFSFLFDITCNLPITTSDPGDIGISPFKVHVGSPRSNPNVDKLKDLMLVKIEETVDRQITLVLPDGTKISDPNFGAVEVLIHTSGDYWKPMIAKLKEWWNGKMGRIIENAEDSIDARIFNNYPQSKIVSVSDLKEIFVEEADSRGLFWEIFKELKEGVRSSRKDLIELLKILKDLAISESVVVGAGENGISSAGMLFRIGQVLPYPNVELLLKLLQDIINKIKGIPHVQIGWPKSDMRIAIVTKYVNFQFFEIYRIVATPKSVAEFWYPHFLRSGEYGYIVEKEGEELRSKYPLPLSYYEDKP